MHTQSHQVTDHFIEQMGLVTQADGLPRIAGQILGLLLMEPGPLGFAELAERLGVSRGSVSTNTRLLEALGMVTRIAKTDARGDFFELAQAPYAKLLTGITTRMENSKAMVQNTRRQLPPSMTVAHTRLADLEHFYSRYLECTTALINSLAIDSQKLNQG